MRVLGIDPGSRITGLGIVESTADGLQSVTCQCIKMGNIPLPQRLGMIYQGVTGIIEKYQPDMVAIEQIFVAHNAKSALVLGHARGSAVCAAVNLKIEVFEYSALQIKRAVVGSGNARKEQVQHMVRVLLGLTRNPDSDEADALACAICHIHTDQVERKLMAAKG